MINNNKPKPPNKTKKPGNPAAVRIKNKSQTKNRTNSGYKYVKGYENINDTDIPANPYYIDLAFKIKAVKWIVIAFLIVFIIWGIVFNSKELNSDNLNYLLRYINIQSSTTSVKSEFYVELDEVSSMCYYKHNIAVLRKNRIDIYDTNGRRNFSHKLIYSNPVVKPSDKYILAYDLGSNKLEIFNSFSRVFEYKSDAPIYGASITDKGNAVYITTEKGYKSAVHVMNTGFNVKYKCMFKKDYIVSADIDDKAEKLAVAGFYADSGDYLSRVILYATNSETPVKIIEIQGEQPYGVKINTGGVYAVFENSFRCYDSSGNSVSTYDFAYRKIQKMSLTSEYAVLVLSEKTLGTDDRILIFDVNGDVLYDNIINEEVTDMQFSQDCKLLYYLTRSGLYKIDIEQKTFEFVTTEYDDTTDNIIYADDKNIFLSGLMKINTVDVK